MADSGVDVNDGFWPVLDTKKTFSGTINIKSENLSAHQELGLLVTSVCKPLIDLDKKQNESLIQCIVLFGGVVGQPQRYLKIILFKKKVTKDIVDSVDPQTKMILENFWKRIVEKYHYKLTVTLLPKIMKLMW